MRFASRMPTVYCLRMERNNISHLLRNIRRLQWISLLVQIALLFAAMILTWILTAQLREKYLWASPALVWLIAGALFLFVLSKCFAWILSRTEHGNAVQVDRLYGLKERLSTYVELKNSNHPFLEPLIHETAGKLAAVSPIQASGGISALRLPAVFFAAILAAVVLIPYLPVPQTIVTKKKEQQQIAESAKEMEKFALELEKKQADNPEMKRLAAELKKLARDMQKPETDKAEALKKLNALDEKHRKALADYQQKLASELQKATAQASGSKSGDQNATAEQKAETEKLAAELKQAMEGQAGSGKMAAANLQTQNLSSKDLKKLKEALKKYQEQKEQAERMRADLSNSIEKMRKGTSPNRGNFTTDSQLKDRDIEKGKGGVEDGAGTTNQDTGPSHFDTKKKGNGQYMEDRTKAEYERLYGGQRENAGKDPVYLESQWNQEGDPQYTNVRNFGLDKEGGVGAPATTTGKQNQGESSVRKERVPPSHEKIVKEYFEAIEE